MLLGSERRLPMIAVSDVSFQEGEIETLAWQAGRFALTVSVPWHDVPVLTSLPARTWLTCSHLTDDVGLTVLISSWRCQPAGRAGLAEATVRFRLDST